MTMVTMAVSSVSRFSFATAEDKRTSQVPFQNFHAQVVLELVSIALGFELLEQTEMRCEIAFDLAQLLCSYYSVKNTNAETVGPTYAACCCGVS